MSDNAAGTKWNDVQLKKIESEYFRDRVAHCPCDEAKLAVTIDHSTAKGGILAAHCPLCHRSYAQRDDSPR